MQSWLDICLHCELNSWAFLIKLRIVVFFLLKLKLLYDVNSLIKMSKNTIIWLRLLKIFLYSTRSSAVNLIFDWVVACNDNTQIKHSVSESVSLIQQLYYLPALSMTIASLLMRIDIRSLICHVNLSSTEIRLELLFCVNVDQNCLKLNSQCFSEFIDIELFLWCFSFCFICI